MDQVQSCHRRTSTGLIEGDAAAQLSHVEDLVQEYKKKKLNEPPPAPAGQAAGGGVVSPLSPGMPVVPGLGATAPSFNPALLTSGMGILGFAGQVQPKQRSQGSLTAAAAAADKTQQQSEDIAAVHAAFEGIPVSYRTWLRRQLDKIV